VTQRNTPEDQNLSEALVSHNTALWRRQLAACLSHRMSLTPLLHSEQQTRSCWMTTKPRRTANKWVMWVTRHAWHVLYEGVRVLISP